MMVTKSINGNYLNETLNKNNEELTFRIAFGLENKDFTNFRIVGIRNASSNVVVDYSQALKEVNSEDLDALMNLTKFILRLKLYYRITPISFHYLEIHRRQQRIKNFIKQVSENYFRVLIPKYIMT